MANRRKRIRVRAGHGTITPWHGGYRAEIMINGTRLRQLFPSEEDAQRYLEGAVRRSFRYGISADKAKVTFKQLVEMFLDAKGLEGRKRTTLQDYRNALAMCVHAWGNIPAQQLGPDHISRLLTQMRTGFTTENLKGEKVEKQPLSPKSIYNNRGVIHAVLKHGVDLDILDRNVCDRVKGPAQESTPTKAWDKSQLQRFLAALDDPRDEAMFWTFATTGMRKGELVGLKWSDIKMDTGDITISRRVVRLGGGAGIDVDGPKTRAGSRTVNVPHPALQRLDAWRKQQIEQRNAAGDDVWKEEDWVFTTRSGRHVEPRWVNKRFADITRRLGIKPITVHGLRHTLATVLLTNFVPVKDVQEILGHSKPTVTLNTYWQSIPGAQQRVSAKVLELLGDAKPVKRGANGRLRAVK